MDFTWYLFSFRGRIHRAKYWLAAFVLLGWALFVLFLRLVADG